MASLNKARPGFFNVLLKYCASRGWARKVGRLAYAKKAASTPTT